MGRISDKLDSRNRTEQLASAGRRSAIRSEALQKLPALGIAAIARLEAAGFFHRGGPGESGRLQFEDGTHAAWLLRDWPSFDLMPQHVDSYEVYLLETGAYVSIREANGSRLIERYDPDRYADKDVEFLAVYRAATKLPRDQYFEKEWASFLG